MAVVLRYHYTVGQCIKAIIGEGIIRPATARVPKGERPIVWFSSNPDWEQTANKGWLQNRVAITLTKEQTRERAGGLFRIGVLNETAPYSWQQLRFLSKMHPAAADRLEEVARERGSNPDEWYGTFHAVTDDKWLVVQELTDEGWVSCASPKSGILSASVER